MGFELGSAKNREARRARIKAMSVEEKVALIELSGRFDEDERASWLTLHDPEFTQVAHNLHHHETLPITGVKHHPLGCEGQTDVWEPRYGTLEELAASRPCWTCVRMVMR